MVTEETAARESPQDGTDARLIRRGHVAGAALVLVLLGVSTFAVWTSQATGKAAADAVRTSGVSDDYSRAANAVGGEESLERKYRLEPSLEVRQRFDTTAAALVSALNDVRRHGNGDDRTLVDAVLLQHRDYLLAVDRLFAATDRGDKALTLQIDVGEADPAFAAIETAVLGAAVDRREISMGRLTHLQRLETLTQRFTPLVFLVGLVMAALLAAVGRGHRRILDAERTQAVHDSLHDALTGLPNRTLLAQRCAVALRANESSRTHTGLLLIDLDRFKEINDTFGHQYGDELLIQVGPRLAAVLPGHTVARLGGDEFAVLLSDIDGVDDARDIATKIRATFDEPFRVAGIALEVDASVGLVISGEYGRDPATLLQHADIAMYIAKARNCGVFAYEPAVDGHSPAKLALLGDLRRALDRGELILHYQPKVSLSTGDMVGVEALVRWQHPDHGLILPDEFIPLAERTGLVAPLTRYVLNSALAQARRWMDAGQPIAVSVNLSARNLLESNLSDEIAETLESHGVPAEMLVIEVTESALMTEPARAQRVLEQLSALGLRISIDDFGAGYTSLGQLRTLPISELKIDRSFVDSMVADPASALIVQSVVDLGHNLGLTIVAEGVETERVMTALGEIGCDIAQGFYVSRPITAASVDAWRAQSSLSAIRHSLVGTQRS